MNSIIALSPHIVENLYFAGAFDKIIATVSHSDFPEKAKSITRIGDHSSYNYELIAQLKPDLIIAWGSGNTSRVIQRIQKLKIPIYISNPNSIEAIKTELRNFAKLTNTPQFAEKSIVQMNKVESELALQTAKIKSLSLFFVVWPDPLQTLSNMSITSKVLTNYCGLSNIFGDMRTVAPLISREAIISSDPNIIVQAAADSGWTQYWQNKYATLSAVINHNLFTIPLYANRPSPRILEATLNLCQQIVASRY